MWIRAKLYCVDLLPEPGFAQNYTAGIRTDSHRTARISEPAQ